VQYEKWSKAMSNEKESGQSSTWFPSFNNLLIIAVAGTLLVTQVPFHDSRPDKSDTAITISHSMDARLWQDPFEAVKEHIERNKDGDRRPGVGDIQRSIRQKIVAFDLKELTVVAVMVPGGPYFEDGETRRRLRYAVLSGFNAAFRYMAEDPDHIDFFEAPLQGKSGAKRTEQVVYEWMVYKAVAGGMSNEKIPFPILVLWLNNDRFRREPFTLLSNLFRELKDDSNEVSGASTADSKVWNIKIIGPYDSDNLQSMAQEFSKHPAPAVPAGFKYEVFSPSATVQESNLLTRVKIERLKAELEKPRKGKTQGRQAWVLNRTFDPNDPKKQEKDFENLSDYFETHKIRFRRVTTTDQHLAAAVKEELSRRGIAPGKYSRVLLVAEWDTLYGHHLPNTFARELMVGHDKECPGGTHSNETFVQVWDIIYEPKIQCIFRFGYLRGLDGEKAKSKDKSNKSSSEKKGGDGEKGEPQKLEAADGDSQFDYVRRLADRAAELDRQIRDATENTALHPIKAVGVLGSDVYDKLLILEALHKKFPDAVFFTNGLDARFLQPEYNKWARNLIMVSRFVLEHDRYLQRDIPPFRDSSQTAFFLATEMALAGLKSDQWNEKFLGQKPKLCQTPLSGATQKDINGWLHTPSIHEVGLSRLFDLNPSVNHGKKPCQISDEPPENFSDDGLRYAILAGALSIFALLCFRVTRQFLAGPAGIWFVLLMATVCFVGPIYIWQVAVDDGLKYGTLAGALSVFALLCFRVTRQFLASPAGIWFVLLMATVCFVGPIYIWQVAVEAANSPEGTKVAQYIADFLEGKGVGYHLFKVIWILFFAAMTLIVVLDDRLPTVGNGAETTYGEYLRVVVSLTAIWFTVVWLGYAVTPGGLLDGGELYALIEGVSMWPSEGIQLIALILAGYFIIETCRYPKRFSAWLEYHFKLPEFSRIHTDGIQLRDIFGRPHGSYDNVLLNEWLAWQNIGRRVSIGVSLAIAYYWVTAEFLDYFGHPHVPYRGISMRLLDLWMREFLRASYFLLLFFVLYAVWTGVCLVERSFPEDRVEWPETTREVYAERFMIDKDELHEWVGMRFVEQLTTGIYGIIGSPLVVALLVVLAWSSYFDNWVMPVPFKLTIGFSLILLFYSDYRLKNAADNARRNALKSLRQRLIFWKGNKNPNAKAEQIERLIGMIEQSDEVVYQSFTQRPIFRSSLLIVAALLADSVDYSLLASKLF
jgi:hypothetical protein